MIYLTSSRDWNSWFSITKSHNLTLKIWDYVNSDNDEKLLLSTESSKSAVFQIKAGTMAIINLKKDELTQYNYLCKNWKKKKTAFEKINQNFIFFCNHLHFTVDMNMIIYFIKNKNSLYKIMKALKKKYSMFTKICWKNILNYYMIFKWFSKKKSCNIIW